MYTPERDILVLVNHDYMNPRTMEEELKSLNIILHFTELPQNFCTAHELVIRNRITSNPKRVLKASANDHLKAFHFLVNKN